LVRGRASNQKNLSSLAGKDNVQKQPSMMKKKEQQSKGDGNLKGEKAISASQKKKKGGRAKRGASSGWEVPHKER